MKRYFYLMSLIFLVSTNGFAQKKWEFGVGNWVSREVIFQKVDNNNGGLSTGLGMNLLVQYQLSPNFSMRTLPGFSFQDWCVTDGTVVLGVRGDVVETALPLHLVHTFGNSERRFRPLLYAGGDFQTVIVKKFERETPMSNQWNVRNTFSGSFGAGFAIRLKRFTLQPEIGYRQSFNSISNNRIINQESFIKAFSFRILVFG